ncbi:MAG TPA: hypothetical protein VEN81_14775 [Planctomycetota bacterium]|nr:hypothetical protein [Planctomycetota bacterium]
MGNQAVPRFRKPGSTCTMCLQWNAPTLLPAVDAAGTSPLEVDALCRLHRARATEGACILCGNRAPWLLMRPASGVGVCRTCFVGWEGEKSAEELERYWQTLFKSAGFWPAHAWIQVFPISME